MCDDNKTPGLRWYALEAVRYDGSPPPWSPARAKAQGIDWDEGFVILWRYTETGAKQPVIQARADLVEAVYEDPDKNATHQTSDFDVPF